MQRINLYQDTLQARRDPFDARRMGLLLLLLALTLAAISAVQAWRQSTLDVHQSALDTQREAAAARVEALQARLQARPDGTARQQRLRAELAAKRALLAYLEDGPSAASAGFADYLDGLADQITEGVWLRRVEIGAGGARLTLAGHALDPGQVPTLIAALGGAPAYAGRSFRHLTIDRSDEAAWRVDFTLLSGPPEGERP